MCQLESNLEFIIFPDDTQPIPNNTPGNQTASNGNELYDVQKKQSSSTKSAVSKHQKPPQLRSGTGGASNKRSEKMINHPWLLTSLKGHTDHVLDIDYSSNGKYLASCSEGMFIEIDLGLHYTVNVHWLLALSILFVC